VSTSGRLRWHLQLLSPILVFLAGCAPAPPPIEPGGEQQTSLPAVRTALISVVEKQLNAMHAGDYARARTFAAAGLRQQFSDETFAIMIQRGYPAIATGRDAFFGKAADNGGQAFLDVRITDTAGKWSWFRYALALEGRDWRIAGVIPIVPPVVSL